MKTFTTKVITNNKQITFFLSFNEENYFFFVAGFSSLGGVLLTAGFAFFATCFATFAFLALGVFSGITYLQNK